MCGRRSPMSPQTKIDSPVFPSNCPHSRRAGIFAGWTFFAWASRRLTRAGAACARASAGAIASRSPPLERRWRGGRAAEGARLESVYAGNRIAGSNPAPSATIKYMILQTIYTFSESNSSSLTRLVAELFFADSVETISRPFSPAFGPQVSKSTFGGAQAADDKAFEIGRRDPLTLGIADAGPAMSRREM